MASNVEPVKIGHSSEKYPVIIYSTTSDKNLVAKLLLLGAEDFIMKANNFDRMNEDLGKILHKQYSAIC